MLVFTVNLQSNENAAFVDNEREETARILEEIAQKIRGGNNNFAVRDINGNSCGEVKAEVRIQREAFWLPAHFASYLINDDASALTYDEAQEIDEWIDSMGANYNGLFRCVGASSESEFRPSNALNSMGADCLLFSFHCS